MIKVLLFEENESEEGVLDLTGDDSGLQTDLDP